MTKAAELRQRQLRQRLVIQVGTLLKDFENRYLGAYTTWNMDIVKRIADRYSGFSTYKEFKENCKAATLKDLHIQPNTRMNEYDSMQAKDYHFRRVWSPIQEARDKMDLENLTTFNFMFEASEGYKRKFNSLIEKLISFNFDTRFLKVERVRSSGGELEILIHNEEVTCHARAIWVNGDIKAPHYRFITTIRAKK